MAAFRCLRDRATDPDVVRTCRTSVGIRLAFLLCHKSHPASPGIAESRVHLPDLTPNDSASAAAWDVECFDDFRAGTFKLMRA